MKTLKNLTNVYLWFLFFFFLNVCLMHRKTTAIYPPGMLPKKLWWSERMWKSPVLSTLYLLWQSSDNRLICSSSGVSIMSPLILLSPFQSFVLIFLRSSVVTPNPNFWFLLMARLLFPSFLFLRDPLADTHTHRRHWHAHHDNIFMSSTRRSSHFGLFMGSLITLCLLALVNTVTTWQHLNIWNTVIISPSSKKDTKCNPRCWILVICPDRSHASVSSAGQT